LTVNLLSGDSFSLQNLQSSINGINDELSRADLDQYNSQIENLEKDLKNIRESIAKISNDILNVREKAARKQVFNERYNGTLTEIAEALERDAHLFEWYKDDFSNIEDTELYLKLEKFIQLHEKYKQIKTEDFDYEIPESNKLVTPGMLQEYYNLINKLTIIKINSSPKNNNLKITCSNFEKLIEQLKDLQNIYNEIDKLQIDFTPVVLKSFLNGGGQEWSHTLNKSQDVLERLEKHDLRKIDKDIEISYPQDKSLKQLKNDAQILLAYLNKGKPLTGFTFSIKKPFLSKDIKERLYFIKSVRVNGSSCDTVEEYEAVLKDISFRQDILELSEIWEKEPPMGSSLYKKFLFFKQIHDKTESLLKLIDKANTLKSAIESISDLRILLFDTEDLNAAIQKAEYSRISKNVSELKDLIERSQTYLKHGNNLHPIRERIVEAYNRVDYHIYSELLNELNSLFHEKKDYLDFKNLRSELYSKIPSTIKLIEENTFSVQDIEKLMQAIYYRDAQNKLAQLMDENYENQLFQSLNELERKEKEIIAKLASTKAWYKLVERLHQNPYLKKHLNAWVYAIKQIGKTGKGKKAIKFREVAQKEMEFCKDSVPCWVMPLYKVVETIHPKQEMFDYVIIDEASQLGPDAIFLLYISKNIIIVGDDKQTSPEYIGVEANIMTPYIERHLKGIPFADYYGTEFSFFDHAKLFCDGMIVLREHFRCMPEIIEFSNRYFYAPEGKELYPLKQYSENRLEPLKTVFCKKGFVEGKGENIINRPEAESIVETIGKLVVDERYNEKTIGIITLQGSKQADMIEDLLLKSIGEKEFHKRKIVCGNSSSFQGDERDIIFLSLVTAHNHNRAALVKPEDERRFNVAVSRAKEQVWLFHSVQLDDLNNKNDLRYKLLDHFLNYKSYQPIFKTPIERRIGTQPEPFDSWFEVDVYNDIVRKQLSVIPQYEVAKGRYRIDMVVLLPDGTKIAVECDGDKWHGPEQYQNDIMRQKQLERCGWQFFRVRGYEYYSNREKALEPLWNMISAFERKESELSKITENIKDERLMNSVEACQLSLWDHDPEVRLTGLMNSVEVTSQLLPDYKKENPINIFEQLDSNSNPNPNSDEIIRYFNLSQSGTYVLTVDKPLTADYVIPIRMNYKNGYILQCYKSGYVNKVRLSALLSKKVGKEYVNGLNRDEELVNIYVIESDKIIGIYFTENGQRKFKAHLTKNISTRDLLHLQGYKVIYGNFEKIEYIILPLEIYDKIKRLVFQSFTANGKLIDNKYYDAEWSIINRYSKNGEDQYHQSQKFTQQTELYENRVVTNKTVKIRFLRNGKELRIKLVDYPTYGSEIIDGVQIVNIKKPIGISLIGKAVGDIVKIGDKDNEIEIIEIQ